MSTDHSPLLTVVVPVFNDQVRIAETLYSIKDYFSEQDYKTSLMVVDDGSNDLSTEIIKFVDIFGAEMKDQDFATLIENVKNVGKGYSIAKALLIAEGQYIVFTDSDLSTPIQSISLVLDKFDQGYDIVIGSRNHKNAEVRNRPLIRMMTSKGFNMLARFFGLTTVSDSQCGFKAYRKTAARAIAERQQTYGFGFDVEHLHIAGKLGYSVAEVPVQWTHDNNSTLSLFSDSIRMFIDLIRIRWIHRHL